MLHSYEPELLCNIGLTVLRQDFSIGFAKSARIFSWQNSCYTDTSCDLTTFACIATLCTARLPLTPALGQRAGSCARVSSGQWSLGTNFRAYQSFKWTGLETEAE